VTDSIDGFSRKKITYIRMVDGVKTKGTIRRVNIKKSLFGKIIVNIDDGGT